MHATVKPKWICALLVTALVFTLGPVHQAVADPAAGKVIPMPKDDQKILEKFLGKGVVGKAVAGKPIDDPLKFVPLENTAWTKLPASCAWNSKHRTWR